MHKLPNGVRIPSLPALNDAIADGNTGFALLLNGGVFSRKTITRKGAKYRVENHIDDTVQMLSDRQMFNRNYTNIGEAMLNDAFVVYEG